MGIRVGDDITFRRLDIFLAFMQEGNLPNLRYTK